MNEEQFDEKKLVTAMIRAVEDQIRQCADEAHPTEEAWERLRDPGEPVPDHVILCPDCRERLRRIRLLPNEKPEFSDSELQSLKCRILDDAENDITVDKLAFRSSVHQLLESLKNWAGRLPGEIASLTDFAQLQPAIAAGRRGEEMIDAAIRMDFINLTDIPMDDSSIRATRQEDQIVISGLPPIAGNLEFYLAFVAFEKLQEQLPDVSRLQTEEALKQILLSSQGRIFLNYDIAAVPAIEIEPGKAIFRLTEELMRLVYFNDDVVTAVIIMS